VVVLVLLIAVCGGSAAQPTPTGAAGPALTGAVAASCPADSGAPIVGLRLTMLPCLADPGRVVRVAVVHGRPEVINVWASWCDPCRREAPLLEAAHRAAGDRVVFLGVDTRDERGAALRFIATSGVTYPQVFDTSAGFAVGVGAVGMPYTLIVDASGRVVYRQMGVLTAPALRYGLARAGVTVVVPG
jgi:thiol-disulfide isomerase/thioredoxin